jgi:hypothetical protein
MPVQVSVVAAFFVSGGLKAGTPLEIASTPDSAMAPEENARINKKSEAPPSSAPFCVATSRASESTGSGSRSPNTVRPSPYRMKIDMTAM